MQLKVNLCLKGSKNIDDDDSEMQVRYVPSGLALPSS
jgi:hypothetical protein